MSLESEGREARPDPRLGLAVTQPGSAGSPDWQFWVLLIGNFGFLLLWCILHFLVSVWYFLLEIVHAVEGYFISSGLLKRYEALNLGKLRYLAIVVGSEEAYQTSEITKLLQWLETIGVKHVCLYDTEGETHAFNKVEVLQLLCNNVKACMQLLFCKWCNFKHFDAIGVLKKSKEAILEKMNNATVFQVLSFYLYNKITLMSPVYHHSLMEVTNQWRGCSANRLIRL